MSSNAQPLKLSDILVTTSFSPESQNDNGSSSSRNPTPEPVEVNEMEEMRRRVLEMRESKSSGRKRGNAWENELANMVLRLTSPTQPSCSQLVAQAETISRLVQQRHLLLDRAQEERDLHQAEKEGWVRTCEALLAQVTKGGPSIYKDQEVGKHAAAIESDNYILRQKLSDAQNRLTVLSSELAQLKPLLLMQPFALAHSHPFLELPKPRKKKMQVVDPENEEPPEENAVAETDPSTPKQSKPRAGQYYRKRDEHMPLSPGHSKRNQRIPVTPNGKPSTISGGPPIPLLPDARAEHLLLAARKIGRERASILTASLYQSAKAKEKAEEELAAPTSAPPSVPPSSPKTPRRPTDAVPTFGSPLAPSAPVNPAAPIMRVQGGFQPPHSFAFVPGRGYPVYSPVPYAFSPHPTAAYITNTSPSLRPRPLADSNADGPITKAPVMSTSTQTPRTSQARMQPLPSQGPFSPSKGGPPTPLDSLLSAAHSVLSSAGSPSKGRQRDMLKSPLSPLLDHPDSPAPKRRRLAAPALTQGPSDARRTMSALDVLADQAMASSGTPSKSRRVSRKQATAIEADDPDEDSSSPLVSKPPPRLDRKSRSKGKGKARQMDGVEDEGGSHSDTSRPSISHPPSRDMTTSPPLQPTVIHIQRQGDGVSVSSASRQEASPEPSRRGHDPQSPSNSHVPLFHDSKDSEDKMDVDRDSSSSSRDQRQSSPRASYQLRSVYAKQDRPPESEQSDAVVRSRSIPRLSPPVEQTAMSQLRTRSLAPIDITPHSLSSVKSYSVGASGPQNGYTQVGPRPSVNRSRSPAVWSKEEDDVLSDAVAKHGQRWDQVQKSLPAKGPDQVRQRWLRKLGMPDSSHSPLGNAPIPKLNLIPPSNDIGLEYAIGRSSTPETDPADDF